VVLTFALGIGVNASVFSVVDAILFRPLPFRDASRLIQIWCGDETSRRHSCSLDDVTEVRTSHLFDEVTAFRTVGPVTISGLTTPPGMAGVVEVPDNFFTILGIEPVFGRTFFSGDSHQNVAILSHSSWLRYFGRDMTTVGKSILADGKSYVVIGVLPDSLRFSSADLWLPFDLSEPARDDAKKPAFYLVGKLHSGEDLRSAATALNMIGDTIVQKHPLEGRNWHLWAEPLGREWVDNFQVRRPLLFLLFASGFVALISCANVSNLFLARNLARQNELALRTALGASRGAIIRHLLLESTLLACFGGTVGLLLAAWSLKTLISIAPDWIPQIGLARFDFRMFLFSGAISLISGAICAVAPATRLFGSANLNSILRADQTLSREVSNSGILLRDLLIAAEIAMSTALLISATLMARSFVNLLELDAGFRTDRVESMLLIYPAFRYGGPGPAHVPTGEIVNRIRDLPGVTGVAVTCSRQSFHSRVSIRAELAETNIDVFKQCATPGYFQTLGLSLLEGRDFDSRDREGGPAAIIVNESLAQRYFAGQDALGKYIIEKSAAGQSTRRVIVGIAPNVRDALTPAFEPVLYIPLEQSGRELHSWLSIRVASKQPNLLRAIESQIWEVDHDIAIENVATMDEVMSSERADPRFYSILFCVFAGMGLFLALLGVCGVVAYFVQRRRHEIGIRLALGALPRDILRLVVGSLLLPTAVGTGVGIAGALMCARFLASLLPFEIVRLNFETLFSVAVFFAAVVFLTCYFSVFKAARVAPNLGLRHD
jgi:putative ABC transport system permease protein